MSNLLKGVALITGAGSGIGQATALAFVQHGITKMALLDIDENGLINTKEMLINSRPGLDVLTIQVDLAAETEVVDAIQNVTKRFGEINIAVNNAGIGGPMTRTSETDFESFRRVLEVNLFGMWIAQREVIRQMLKQPKGSNSLEVDNRGVIVNMSSMYGLLGPHAPTPASAYTSSKHAVLGLTKTDANCYAQDGIRINAICPGFVQTAAMREAVTSGNSMQSELDKVPLGRFAEPQEIAEAISFLASPMSSYMSGACLVVDGFVFEILSLTQL